MTGEHGLLPDLSECEILEDFTWSERKSSSCREGLLSSPQKEFACSDRQEW